MRVLVTGGRGFIGSALIESLRDKHEVKSLDIGVGASVKHLGVSYIRGCCSEIHTLDYFKPDVVVHLGEYSRVQQSYIEPLKAMQNISSTLPFVLEYCRRNSVKLVYAGSSTKFGNALSPYSIAKAANTELVKAFCEMYEMPYAITYFYNAYGAGEIATGKYATVVAKFIKAKKSSTTVNIYGSGMQKRNFTHVKDIVSGIDLVIQKGKGDGYSIGCRDKYSVLDLAKMIGVKYRLVDDMAGNRTTAHIDTSKTEGLGWQATRTLEGYIDENR